MILTGQKIIEEVKSGNITIKPFTAEQINPNSYNFRLGDTLLTYDDEVLDVKKSLKTTAHKIPKEGFVLQPDKIYLGHTLEIMGSEHYVPIIRGRSSIGRIGLFVNATADLIDIGSINQWTLQFHATQPVRIYPGMLIGQVTFWKVKGKVQLYAGKYQGSVGPASSQIHKDFMH